MIAQELTCKYVSAMEKTLQSLHRNVGSIVVKEECIDEIMGYVRAYLDDAKYFSAQKRFEVSLTSIAYCEGLLDALKLVGAVEVRNGP
jgi:hypothetical protein